MRGADYEDAMKTRYIHSVSSSFAETKVLNFCLTLKFKQGRGDGPKASTSWASEAARVKAELDCATVWVCFAYVPKP